MYVMYLIIIISAILVWFGLSFLYKAVGKFVRRYFGDAIDIMKQNDNENNGGNENEE